MSKNRELCPPSDEELVYLGFEPWQISLLRKLNIPLQWDAYDEFVRRLMGGEMTDSLFF